MGMPNGDVSAKTWEEVAENLETKPSAETDKPTVTAEEAVVSPEETPAE